LPASQFGRVCLLAGLPAFQLVTMQQSTQQNCSSSQRSHYSNVLFDLAKSSVSQRLCKKDHSKQKRIRLVKAGKNKLAKYF